MSLISDLTRTLELPAPAALLLAHMLDIAEGEERITRSLKALAEAFGLSASWARKWTRRLSELGCLGIEHSHREGGWNGTDTYIFAGRVLEIWRQWRAPPVHGARLHPPCKQEGRSPSQTPQSQSSNVESRKTADERNFKNGKENLSRCARSTAAPPKPTPPLPQAPAQRICRHAARTLTNRVFMLRWWRQPGILQALYPSEWERQQRYDEVCVRGLAALEKSGDFKSLAPEDRADIEDMAARGREWRRHGYPWPGGGTRERRRA